MKLSFATIFGSLRILRRRAVEVGQPGLAGWADAGERAAVCVQASVRDQAHQAEVGALGIETSLREILADGKVTPAEVRRLKGLAPRVRSVAEKCHDVGEVVL